MEKEKTSEPRYLLVFACSQRKRPDVGLLPAIERYDGVNFRVLHKAKRKRKVLSAGKRIRVNARGVKDVNIYCLSCFESVSVKFTK